MKKTTIAIIIIIVLAIIGFFVYRSQKPATPSPKTELAQCLKDKGAKFYGSYWCPHCNNQKLAFGTRAAKKLPYVECALYPTEVSAVAKQVLRDYNAGTYTGGYLKQLDEAKTKNELEKWEPSQTEACTLASIESYPTWILADGTKLPGEQSPEKLATATSCEYVAE